MLRHVTFLRRCAPVMRNDELVFLQELVGYAHAFAEQAAGIAPQIENQTLEIAKLIQSSRNFFFRGLVESVHVHVADSRPDQEMYVHAVTRNLVAHQGEFHRLLHAFARDADVHRRPFRPLEHVGDFGRAHVFRRLSINRDDHVAGMNAGLIRWRAGEGENHNDLVVARPHRHAHAVVLAALVFAHQRVRFGIEEIRMRIERVQHARDGSVVDRLVGVDRLGVVFLDDGVDIRELLQAVFDIGVAARATTAVPCAGRKESPESRRQEERKLRGRANGENYVPS